MHDFEHLKHMIGSELEEYQSKGRLSGGDLGAVQLLCDAYKNLCKIKKMSEESSYDGGDSGRHYVRGHYSREGGSWGENSRRYSRSDAKDRMMEQLGEMMRDADEQTREELKRCMRRLEEC